MTRRNSQSDQSRSNDDAAHRQQETKISKSTTGPGETSVRKDEMDFGSDGMEVETSSLENLKRREDFENDDIERPEH